MKIAILPVLFFYTLLNSQVLWGQNTGNATNYLHIRLHPEIYTNDSLIGFIFTNIDTLGTANWRSEQISDFEMDHNKYLVKVDIPSFVLHNSKKIWCTSVSLRPSKYGFDTITKKYGGVKLSNIKLILKSTPEGAETYLVPNRIWMNKIENTPWDKDASILQKYRVNTSSTDTYAYVDETVYVVVYKMGSKYKTTTHYTKPANTEQQQTVWVQF